MATDWPAMTERGPQVAEAAVAAFEAQLGATLPQDYRSFLLEVNGGRTARSHRVFAIRMQKARTDETTLNGLHSLDDPDDRGNLAQRWKNIHRMLPKDVLPIGSDSFGGTVVLALGGPRRGQVWFLDGADPRPEGSNPRVEWFDRRDVSKLADSFREFMDGLRPLDE